MKFQIITTAIRGFLNPLFFVLFWLNILVQTIILGLGVADHTIKFYMHTYSTTGQFYIIDNISYYYGTLIFLIVTLVLARIRHKNNDTKGKIGLIGFIMPTILITIILNSKLITFGWLGYLVFIFLIIIHIWELLRYITIRHRDLSTLIYIKELIEFIELKSSVSSSMINASSFSMISNIKNLYINILEAPLAQGQFPSEKDSLRESIKEDALSIIDFKYRLKIFIDGLQNIINTNITHLDLLADIRTTKKEASKLLRSLKYHYM